MTDAEELRQTAHDARLGRVLREVAVWAEETFGATSTPSSKAKHLVKEARELEADPTNAEEMADVMMILGHLAAGLGVDLATEIERKLAINRGREWAPADADGVVEHKRGGNAAELAAALEEIRRRVWYKDSLGVNAIADAALRGDKP